MKKTVEPMTSGPIWKRMTLFALPILLGNLFQQLYNTVDSLIVGNYLGSDALAAVSSSGSLIFMLIGFLQGVAAGAGIIIAKLFGAEDEENLEKAVHTTVAFGLAAGVVMTFIGVMFSPHILRWMGTPESVMPNSLSYMQIYFGGAMALVMYNTLVGILQAVGDSRHPLYYLIASSIINLILDIIFIGFLHTGVGGAAFATVISQSVSALLCALQLLTVKDSYRVKISKIRFNIKQLKDIIKIGLPSGVQNSIIAIANVVVQSYVNSFGAIAMAGTGVFAKIEGFGFLPITSFNLALTTFVGQNLGAKEYERTKKGAHFGILASVISAELIGLIIFLLAPQLIGAFDPNPEVIAIGVAKTKVTALFFCLLAYSHAMAAIMRGAGKAIVPMVVMMLFWCIVRVTFLSVMVPLTKSILAVYWVYPLTWLLSSLAFTYYYRKINWLRY